MPLPRLTDGDWSGVSDQLNAVAAEIDWRGIVCKLARTTPSVLPHNSYRLIEWQTVDVDTYGGMWDEWRPEWFTVAVTGLYLCVLQVRFSLQLANGSVQTGAPYNAGWRSCAVLLNGSNRDQHAVGTDRKPNSTNGEGVTLAVTTIRALRAGDQLACDVWQDSGASLEGLHTDFAGTYFAATRLAPFDASDLPPPLQRSEITEDFADTAYTVPISGSWTRTNSRSWAGMWSLRSAAIGHNQTSDVAVTVPAGATTLNYHYSVQSESGYDFFSVLVDGVQRGDRVSGDVGWTPAMLDVTGARTVTFRYSKDVSTVYGDDCAWIDELVFTVYR